MQPSDSLLLGNGKDDQNEAGERIKGEEAKLVEPVVVRSIWKGTEEKER